MKMLHILTAALLITGTPMSVLAEPPPYGPNEEWAGCIDNLPNVDGLLGVVCSARIGAKGPAAPRVVASAKASCMTMERASFELIKGQYYCKYVTRPVRGKPIKPGLQPTAAKH